MRKFNSLVIGALIAATCLLVPTGTVAALQLGATEDLSLALSLAVFAFVWSA
jgi:hypothetical protein